MSEASSIAMVVATDENIKDSSDSIKPVLQFSDIASTILYISRGVETNQPRFVLRGIRQNVVIRKTITSDLLKQVVRKFVPVDVSTFNTMSEAIELLPATPLSEGSEEEKNGSDAMEIDSEIVHLEASNIPATTVLPEVEVYIFNLIVTTLLRFNLNNEAAKYASLLIDRIRTFNRRSLDILSSKAYYYFSLAYEKINRSSDIIPTLLALFRTACIRHDDMGQAVLLNQLLRTYLQYNQVEAAHTLSLRASFPENASNNQFCRYLYYMGRIQAVQLDYSEAFQRLTMALRKAPQGHALGFTVSAQKLAIIVQLLMGDIPERSVFNQPELRAALLPYLVLTQAVRNGDLIQFNSAMEMYNSVFKADKNESLIQRLGHNVLKTGLRKISTSYSRISLQDIADKLHLSSATAAEYICAKAIRDGVIEAKIDHELGALTSQEVLDVYSTEEPQNAFHKRIAFCLDIHNEAVKSMRYPPSDTLKKPKSDGPSKQDEMSIEELIKEFHDDMEGDDE